MTNYKKLGIAAMAVVTAGAVFVAADRTIHASRVQRELNTLKERIASESITMAAESVLVQSMPIKAACEVGDSVGVLRVEDASGAAQVMPICLEECGASLSISGMMGLRAERMARMSGDSTAYEIVNQIMDNDLGPNSCGQSL